MSKRWLFRTLLTIAVIVLFNPMLAAVAEAPPTTDELAKAINTVWVLLAGFLVFFMQSGFGFLEAGFVRSKNVVNIMAENFIDTTMTTIGFWAVGFGIMFGAGNGLFGKEWFFFSGLPAEINGLPFLAVFFFHFAFSAASSTIASGLMAERTDFKADMVYSFIVGALIYPLVGHWVWSEYGWLAQRGMLDFAGSTVVHLVGACVGLAGSIMLGKRKDKVWGKPICGHNISIAALGTFILWLGWFGFNAGSTLNATDVNAISLIVLNTHFSATTGAIVAIVISYVVTKKWDVGMAFNGCLGGLVAITAPCAFVTPGASLVIGVIAGTLVYGGTQLMEIIRVDDPVGAFPVHGINGMFGTLAVGIWGAESGILYGHGMAQLGVQALGVLATVGFVLPVSLLVFFIIKHGIGLRVSAAIEESGIDMAYHGQTSYPEFIGGWLPQPEIPAVGE
jgi:ammonium transporter, Amt family